VNNRATNYPLIENILLENNLFEDITGLVINAKSFKNLVFRNNEIRQRGKVANVNDTCGWMSAELGQGLWVENNTWSLGSDQAPPRLFYDRATTKLIGVQGNRLKN
jgi:pectate lyase